MRDNTQSAVKQSDYTNDELDYRQCMSNRIEAYYPYAQDLLLLLTDSLERLYNGVEAMARIEHPLLRDSWHGMKKVFLYEYR